MYSIGIFILHFTYLGGEYAPNAPPAYGPASARSQTETYQESTQPLIFTVRNRPMW